MATLPGGRSAGGGRHRGLGVRAAAWSGQPQTVAEGHHPPWPADWPFRSVRFAAGPPPRDIPGAPQARWTGEAVGAGGRPRVSGGPRDRELLAVLQLDGGGPPLPADPLRQSGALRSP